MPTYTVLGGTGATGQATLRALIANPPPNLALKIYARSEERLLSLLPSLSTYPNTTIITGSLSNPTTVSQCLEDADIIFSCIANNASEPGMTIAVSTASLILSSLSTIRGSNTATYKTPTILILTSASVNPSLTNHPPFPIFNLLKTCLHYHYSDLLAAESLYKTTFSSDPGLMMPIFVQPPGIMPGDVPTGYELSTTTSSITISYADLGVAMVEIAERREEFGNRGVSMVAKDEVKQDWRPNAWYLWMGLWAYWFPGLWSWGRGKGWW